MTRVSIALLLVVMASAMVLVHTQYESRLLYTALDRADIEARRLRSEFQRLQVQKSAQSTPLRIERLARDRLQMRPASPAITQYVTDPGANAPVPAPDAGGGQ
ncbi:hypothetical protein GCM10022279_03550 [Comamonas faecalis]|uniref:Cell division protein FtsL n=1 Tax=Comamonas faecalis TaxID=1387849 RepID=A0ABP7QJ51_9BURK